MNPFFPAAVVLGTLGALAVKTYDQGKTSSPPASVVGQMLSVGAASSTAAIATSSAAIVVANTITGAIYDTWFGRSFAGDDPTRSDLTYSTVRKSTADL
jgi:hypothetical protein